MTDLISAKILAEENRGVLLDIVVFFLNVLLMQWLTHYVIELFRGSQGEVQEGSWPMTLG